MELQLMTFAYRRNQSRMAQGEAKSGAGGQIAEIHVDHTEWSQMRVKLKGSSAALSRNRQTSIAIKEVELSNQEAKRGARAEYAKTGKTDEKRRKT